VYSRYLQYRQRLLTEWEADIGPEAARIRWNSSNYQLGSWFLAAAGTAAGIAAAYSHGSTRSVLIWVCIILMCVAGIGICAMLYTFRRWKNASRRWRTEKPS
jgi:ABC-type multidrug transport system permease subunit